ncbi:MAG: archease [Thermoprotei archaeon]
MAERIVQPGLPGKFDFLEHTADIYIVAYGDDLLELFENAGLALFESMTSTSKVEPKLEYRVNAEGFDLESLLYKWLEELLFIYYSENVMCSVVRAEKLVIERIGDKDYKYALKGICRGEKFDPNRHEAKVEVKAVTYHLMRIVRENSKWKAYFVLDI